MSEIGFECTFDTLNLQVCTEVLTHKFRGGEFGIFGGKFFPKSHSTAHNTYLVYMYGTPEGIFYIPQIVRLLHQLIDTRSSDPDPQLQWTGIMDSLLTAN